MSRVQGGRVKEPRIVARAVLPSDKRSSSWKDLAQAWASLGEAKSVLQKLDDLSPPHKEKPLASHPQRNHVHRTTKPSTVHFASGGSSNGLPRDRKPAEILSNAKVPNVHWKKDIGAGATASHVGSHRSSTIVVGSGYSTEDSEKENVVEGPVLNGTAHLPPSTCTGRRKEGGRMELSDTDSSMSPPSRALKTTPTPSTCLPTPPKSSSHLPPPSSTLLQYTPASDPNVIALSPSRPHQTHSNAHAVFGPPVSFGDCHRQLPSRVTSRPGSELEPKKPLTRKTHTSAPTLSSSHWPPVTDSNTCGGVRGTSSFQTPIRKFELPAETLDSLRSRVEQQKLAVQATALRMDALKPSTTSAVHPLPEATSSSSFFAPSHSHGHLLPPGPAPHPTRPPHVYSGAARTQEVKPSNTGATKRRKVASVPPPPTYIGFSSVDLKVNGESLHWRPNLEKVGRPRTEPSGSADGVGVARASRPLASAAPGRVRKVRRVAAISDAERGGGGDGRRPPQPPHPSTRKAGTGPGVITPSSWRSGKELADQILKHEVVEDPLSARSTSQGGSETSSITGLKEEEEEEADRVESPFDLLGGREEGGTNGTELTHAAQLLEDLEMFSLDGHGDVPPHGPKRCVSVPTSSTFKKPRYNFEPVYPTQKQRHYDQGKVQHYMVRKQEERKRRDKERQLAEERARREREERLQMLYAQQRRRLEVNLRNQQRQKESYSQAMVSAPLHIHIHDSVSSRSESDVPLEGHQTDALIVTPSHSHPITSPWVSSAGGVVPASPSISLPGSTQSSPRQRSQFPSPPQATVMPNGSPPQATALPNGSPLRYSSLQQPQTLSAEAGGLSPLSTSPRTHSIHRSPPKLMPSPRRELVPSPPIHPPPAHTQLSPGRGKRLHPSPWNGPPSGELTALMRGSQGGQRSREERIEALTLSALRLKERIAMESRKLIDSQQPDQAPGEEVTHTQSSSLRAQTQFGESYTPRSAPTQSVSFPGVHSIHRHALQAEKVRREAEAAMKIQATYRGYQVRKSLRWQLPLGGTLGGGRAGDGAEAESEEGGRDREEDMEEVIELEPSAVGPSLSEPQRVSDVHSPLPVSQSCPVFPTSAPIPPAPWEQPGGDTHSVINVFARQHERLRERLAELRNQKIMELQEIQQQASNARAVGTERLEELANSSRGEGALPQTYSYSQTFEEPSHGEMEEEEGEDGGSQISGQFSQDSLVPPGSQSTPSQPTVTSATSHTVLPTLSSLTESLTETGGRGTTGPSVITPPGSPSFIDTFTDHIPPLEPRGPKAEWAHPPSPPPQGGRLSPRSLEVKLKAELNLLESVEESMRQLSALENTRAVSLAQQETVTLAQVLKSRQQSHEREMDSLASKAKREVEEASSQFKRVHDEALLASEQVRRLREEADTQARDQARRLAKLQEESVAATQEATRQLLEARSSATSAVTGAAQQQLQAAHDIAVSAASAAAKHAVKAALVGVARVGVADSSESADYSTRVSQDETRKLPHDGGSFTPTGAPTYPSDFEPSTMQPDSLAEEEENSGSSDLEGQSTPRADHSGEKDGSIEESLTPVATDLHMSRETDGTLEGEEGRGSPSPGTPSPEEESVDEEASFRELLPSESHRRRRIRHHHSTDSESRGSTPSRPQTPTTAIGGGELSPVGVEDTFFRFMDKMVRQYMREEELRTRHQSNLLDLRERALQERTQAELEWLRLKKKQIRSKGADDLMPPLVRREKGLLMRLEEEQAEIRQLQEVQKAASNERKLMFMQQREISKIRRSAQYYRQQIHRYRSQEGGTRDDHLLSPTPDREISSFSSLDGSLRHTPAHSISEDLSDEVETPEEEGGGKMEHFTLVAASQTPTFPTYSPSTVTPQSVSKGVTHEGSQTGSSRKPSGRRADNTLNTPTTDSATIRKLKKIASGGDTERQLGQREQRLAKRRHIAEAALRKQQELSTRERQLDQEEEMVNQLIGKVEGDRQDRQDVRKNRSGHRRSERVSEAASTHEAVSASQPTPTRSPLSPVSVSEHLLTTESVPEIPSEEDGEESPTEAAPKPADHPLTFPTASRIPTEYASDTFESLEGTLTHPHVTSSTPIQPQAMSHDVLSSSESLKITSSVSESLATTMSEGSVIEARIRQLKEQLRARKEEARRIQSEQKRKKKDILRQQEEQLKRKLEAVESVISKSKWTASSPPPPLEIFSLSSSSVATSQTESAEATSDEGDRTPRLTSFPHQPLTIDLPGARGAVDTTEEVHELQGSASGVGRDSRTAERDETPGIPIPVSVQQAASEVPTELSETHPPMSPNGQELSYTGFSDSLPSTEEGGPALQGTDSPTAITEAARSVAEALEHVVESVQSVPEEVELKSPPPEEEEPQEVTPGSSISEDITLEEEEGEEEVEEGEEEGEDDEQGEREEEREEGEERDDVLQPPAEPSYSETFEAPSASYTAAFEPVPPMRQLLEVHDYLTPPSSLQDEADISIGQRVLIGNVMAGTVQFVGHTHFADGLWIGVELDMSKGRNDGSIDDHRYFQCDPNHGLFAPPSKVSLFDEEEEAEKCFEEGSVAEEIESSYSSSHDEQAPGEGDGGGEGGEAPRPPELDIMESKKEEITPTASPVCDSYTADFESEHEQLSIDQRLPASLPPQGPEGEPKQEHTLGGGEGGVAPLPASLPPQGPEREPTQEHTLGGVAKLKEEEEEQEMKEDSEVITESIESEEEGSLDTTPPPPPEFAEDSPSHESPITLTPAPSKDEVELPDTHTHHLAVNTIANDLVQDLSNEAYETMHHLWQSKKTVVPRNKEIPLTLDGKADRIADELLAMLLQSDTNLVCDIHSAKKSLESPSPPPPPSVAAPPKPRPPPSQLTISIPSSPIIECSPPPLSPPSPYRSSPPPSDFSPPGSPPKHLSQASQARVTAGDRTLISATPQEPGTPTIPRKGPAVMERSVSVESISQLLESIKLTTAQCMVPSERQHVNKVVEYAWNTAKNMASDQLHTTSLECPQEVLSMFADLRELNLEEDQCRVAYVRLLYDLSMEMIRTLHPTPPLTPVWTRRCSVGTQLRNHDEVTMEMVQRKVYAALMRGQLPPQLPSVKFLHRMRRPGGREIDFVDAILIKELRDEEPSWVDYGEEEEEVKVRTADAILDQLLSEAVHILCKIEQKRRKS